VGLGSTAGIDRSLETQGFREGLELARRRDTPNRGIVALKSLRTRYALDRSCGNTTSRNAAISASGGAKVSNGIR